MDIDFELEDSDSGDGKSDHTTPTPTPSPSPEPSDLRNRQVFTPTPTPSTSPTPSPSPDAPSSSVPRPPVPLPPPGSGRLGYLLGVCPNSSKVQGGGSSTSAPPRLQPTGMVAGARPKKRPSPLGAASDAKNSHKAKGKVDSNKGKGKVNNDKGKGKATCVTSCNSQALQDGQSESVNEDRERVVISDEDEDDVKDMTPAAKRRLTSKVWKEMEKKNIK